MGVAESPLFGNMTGTVGNVIIYKVGDQIRFRGKPIKYKDAKTPSQVAQRKKMKGVSKLYHELSLQLLIYWRELAQEKRHSGYNMFVSHNVRNLNSDGVVEDFSLFKICQGTLPLPQEITVEMIAEKTFRIKWDTSTPESIQLDDLLQIAAYTPQRASRPKIRVIEQTQVTRRRGCYEFQIPDSLDKPAHLYLFFKGSYTNEVTSSFYIGALG